MLTLKKYPLAVGQTILQVADKAEFLSVEDGFIWFREEYNEPSEQRMFYTFQAESDLHECLVYRGAFFARGKMNHVFEDIHGHLPQKLQ
jgi:hypothetical protein